MTKESKTTIVDIARVAGVSPMTVSRVLNNKGKASQQTRERVLQIAEQLGYEPNISARSLVSSRSFHIGLLHDSPNSYYFNEILIGVLNRCRQNGYYLIIENCGDDFEHIDYSVSDRLKKTSLDGIILTERVSNFPPVRKAIREQNLKCVRISSEFRQDGTPHVCIDNKQAAYEMTTYLYSLGHRRIGYIKGNMNEHVSKLRFSGYKEALSDLGIRYSNRDVRQGEFQYEIGMEQSEKLLTQKKPPTAIFACNDYVAAGCLATAMRLGIRVPEDLSIAGFDDVRFASLHWPRLTTIRQDIFNIASESVDILIKLIDGNYDASRQALCKLMPHQLMIRESTGPAPATTDN